MGAISHGEAFDVGDILVGEGFQEFVFVVRGGHNEYNTVPNGCGSIG